MFYQITKNEKHTIKNKINKNWKTIWNKTYCLGLKILLIILGLKK